MSIRLVMETSSPRDAYKSSCYEISGGSYKSLCGLPGLPSSLSVKTEIGLRMNGPLAILDIAMSTRSPDLIGRENAVLRFASALKDLIATGVTGVLIGEKSALPSSLADPSPRRSPAYKTKEVYNNRTGMSFLVQWSEQNQRWEANN